MTDKDKQIETIDKIRGEKQKNLEQNSKHIDLLEELELELRKDIFNLENEIKQVTDEDEIESLNIGLDNLESQLDILIFMSLDLNDINNDLARIISYLDDEVKLREYD